MLVQPLAADEVASTIATISVRTPLNGSIEIAGPEQFLLDELIRRALDARDDERRVAADRRVVAARFNDWASEQ